MYNGVDGVWWNEEYDPDGYSAPRGGIFPGKVVEWHATQIDFDDVDDEEELEKLDDLSSKGTVKFGF